MQLARISSAEICLLSTVTKRRITNEHQLRESRSLCAGPKSEVSRGLAIRGCFPRCCPEGRLTDTGPVRAGVIQSGSFDASRSKRTGLLLR